MPDIDTFFEEIDSPSGEMVSVPKVNIAEDLDETTLQDIGRTVCEGYDSDESTMSAWEDGVERGLALVELEESTKDTPFPNAANYKSPTLMGAALKWSDRAATELLRGDELVQPKIIGEDPNDLKLERGERVSSFLNYQVNIQMEEWREEQDKLLYDIPYTGTVFKKVFYDPGLERNVSNLVVYPNFVVDNNVTSLNRLRRFSEIINLPQNTIRERQLQGLWLDVDFMEEGENQDGDQDFIEQLGWYDMDEDGYEEPYAFVVHKSTQKVARIIPRFSTDNVISKNGKILRIEPDENLIKYGFLRDPQGGFLDVGYGHLLSSITEGINTNTNMLLDAGKFANLQGGFLARGFRKNKGPLTVAPGVWKETNISAVDLQNSMVPHIYKEPSSTLFSLMQFMIAGSQELSASADMTSALGANAPAATTLALVQEQQLSAGAIILRIYRAMGKEFNLLYKLTKEFGDPAEYQNVVDDPNATFDQDFEQDRMDFVPVANPEISSRLQRIQQAQVELSGLQEIMMAGGDIRPVVRNFYEAIGSENVDQIFPELPPDQRLIKLLSENPDLQAMIMDEQDRQDAITAAQMDAMEQEQLRRDFELELKGREQGLKERDQLRKEDETEAKIILDLEKAETESEKNEVDTYVKLTGAVNDQSRVTGVEIPPGDRTIS